MIRITRGLTKMLLVPCLFISLLEYDSSIRMKSGNHPTLTDPEIYLFQQWNAGPNIPKWPIHGNQNLIARSSWATWMRLPQVVWTFDFLMHTGSGSISRLGFFSCMVQAALCNMYCCLWMSGHSRIALEDYFDGFKNELHVWLWWV